MSRADVARQAVTVAGAVGQAVLPVLILPRLRRDLTVPDVAQPAPYAFAVWLPIYATSVVYAATVLWALAGVVAGQYRQRPSVALAAAAAALPVIRALVKRG